MNKTPRGNREHIVFYGKRNVGKSSLINQLIGQEVSIVSPIKGTTTDPVSKSVELIPYGPVVFIDTAGIDDQGSLGQLRKEKTLATLNKADLAVYVLDSLEDEYRYKMVQEFKKRNIPYLLVYNKIDISKNVGNLEKNFIATSIRDKKSLEKLKNEIIEKLELYREEGFIFADLLDYKSKVLLVIDIDSSAPKGRLILPQVQVLREAVDNGIISTVIKDTELESYIKENTDLDLVITDSKIFKKVNQLVPTEINLTSFSILMARNKGDLNVFVEGVRSIPRLKKKDRIKILIAENCSHAFSHEDIGQVKIPNILRKQLERDDIEFVFKRGEDFSLDNDIDLVIHCGACMVNRKTMLSRIDMARQKSIPITNYGVFIAYSLGILERTIEIFYT